MATCQTSIADYVHVVGKLSALDQATLEYFQLGAELHTIQIETEEQKHSIQATQIKNEALEKNRKDLQLKKLKLQIQSFELQVKI